MMKLCPDCFHYLYEYPNCEHDFQKEDALNVIGMERLPSISIA